MSADDMADMTTKDIARTIKHASKPTVREAVAEERAAQAEERAMMFAADEADGYRTRWDGIQTGFVDEPRRAVEEADALVAQVIKRLSEVFADERTALEQQWGRGDQISTEDLRLALRKYRSFFERLLTL
jgi:glutathione S-transferase